MTPMFGGRPLINHGGDLYTLKTRNCHLELIPGFWMVKSRNLWSATLYYKGERIIEVSGKTSQSTLNKLARSLRKMADDICNISLV